MIKASLAFLSFGAIVLTSGCQNGQAFAPMDFQVGAAAQRAPYPQLLPLQAGIQLRDAQPRADIGATNDDLAARAAALRTRARGLQADVIAQNERARLDAARQDPS